MKDFLDENVLTVVPVATNRVTKISFPSAITAIDGAGVTVDGKTPGLFQLAHTKGSAFLSVRTLFSKASANLNSRWNDRTYVFELLESAVPVLSLNIESLPTPEGDATNGIAAPGLGDWNGLRANTNTPNNLIATALYFGNARAIAQSARLLGIPDDAAAYEQLAETIRPDFNTAFFHTDTQQYGTGSQCANAMALDLGLVEPTKRPAVFQHIVEDLAQQHYAMTIGEVGLPYLLRALAAGGRSDVIHDMANQTEYPGYGYQSKMGATALPEWNGGRNNTQIQFILGHISEWFYHDPAGIQLDHQSPGFKHFIIYPDVGGDLTEVKASYDSIHGKIVGEWKLSKNTITMHVVVPSNTTATIDIPAVNTGSVTEGGKLIVESGGIAFLNFQDSHESYQVGSGDYTFKAEMPTK
jgi:alpha-L-rhamnosidase